MQQTYSDSILPLRSQPLFAPRVRRIGQAGAGILPALAFMPTVGGFMRFSRFASDVKHVEISGCSFISFLV